MTEESEAAWVLGNKSAYLGIARECLRHLNPADMNAHSWAIERAETIAVLRRICEQYGDNEWQDGLHLADVLTKHLEDHLEAS